MSHPLLLNDENESEKLIINANSAFSSLQQTQQINSNDDEKKNDEEKMDLKEELNELITIKILMIRKAEPFFVDITIKSTILELKGKIEKLTIKEKITADRMRLIYKGHALKNNETVKKNNIKNGHA
eukprot:261708_1